MTRSPYNRPPTRYELLRAAVREVQRSRLSDNGKRAALAEIAERYAG